MYMLCITTFGQFGKIKGITFNKVYRVKFVHNDKILIKNDLGKPQMVKSDNFVNYKNLKKVYN